MFQSIDPKQLQENVFSLIGDQWTLITAGTPDHCNTMTASWGGLGVLWRKPVATIYVRPQRYTYTFLEENPYFTLSFFGPQWKKTAGLLRRGQRPGGGQICRLWVSRGGGGAGAVYSGGRSGPGV